MFVNYSNTGQENYMDQDGAADGFLSVLLRIVMFFLLFLLFHERRAHEHQESNSSWYISHFTCLILGIILIKDALTLVNAVKRQRRGKRASALMGAVW